MTAARRRTARHRPGQRSAARGGRAQLAATSISSVALTSGCSLIATWCAPTVLIGFLISIRRLSSSGPPAASTAAAMSAGETDPNSLPPPPALRLQPDGQRPEPARGIPGVVEAPDLADRAASLDQVDLLLRAARPAHRQDARDEVIPAVSAGDIHDVARSTQAVDFLGEDELHRRTAHRRATSLSISVPGWCTAAAPSRASS